MISKGITRRTSKSCISAEIRELAIGQNFPYHHSKRPNVRLHCIIPVTWFGAMIVWPYALWRHPLKRKSFRLTRPNISGKRDWSRVFTFKFYKDKIISVRTPSSGEVEICWEWSKSSWDSIFRVIPKSLIFAFSGSKTFLPSDGSLQFWTEPYWNI